MKEIMVRILKNIVAGIVIGFANIIPGVSGGTMMVAMGIYDKLIHSITHLFKEFVKSLVFLAPIAVGMGIAVISGSFSINIAFEFFPFQTSLLFVGLVVGGLPAMWKNVKGKKVKPGHILACLAFFAVVVVMALMGETEGNAADLSFNLINVLKLFGVGVIAAATMVIPGVSGSMMLLLLGYYNPILAAIADFFSALVAFDMDGLLKGFGILFPFGIGVLVGIFAVAKLIEIIFTKCPLYAYWAIIGLIVASPIAILAMGSFGTIGIISVITGVLTFAVGYVVAMLLGKLEGIYNA